MKYVYSFAENHAEGTLELKEILGNKGANLHEMCRMGLPVPPGFTIGAEVCQHVSRHGQHPKELEAQVNAALKQLEQLTEKGFGSAKNPLLLSVRSGAAVSMPGMMDTVLNLGLNEQTLQGLIAKSHDEHFAWDAYRRLIQMFADVVRGVEHDLFDQALEQAKRRKGVRLDSELSAEDLKQVASTFKQIYERQLGEPFPDDPRRQLWAAIDAVFKSWNTPRAIKYRDIHGLAHDSLGTAANVQTMVFGNRGDASASGVAFTRNPATGEREAYGEFLLNAQGEDVVAGIRTPQPLGYLKEKMPQVYARLLKIFAQLETHFRDMQDVEFTVEQGKLYILQTRSGKRTARSAARIAVDLVQEKAISKQQALLRIAPEQLTQLLHRNFERSDDLEALAVGLAASPGAAVGQAVFTAAEAEDWAKSGKTTILVRHETSPDDIGGMQAAQGILTSRGGFTSHAAIVARGMGKPCVTGCETLDVDVAARRVSVNGQTIREGDWISIDGATGEVFIGKLPLSDAKPDPSLQTLLGWADETRTLGVRANADTPLDAQHALELGAEGIGLARTEHMFFDPARLRIFQEVIIRDDAKRRAELLAQLGQFQQSDFEALLGVMDDRPVVIRLLDPPLHEFLPKDDAELKALAGAFSMPASELRGRVDALQEFNPMLGHRGCRLGVTSPEIYEMQVAAIARATARLEAQGKHPRPQIMIPLIGSAAEMRWMRALAERAWAQGSQGRTQEVKIGTMIELPRACVVADQIAQQAEFFSFGTNDLTQMAYGFSRDDAEKFLPAYRSAGLLAQDPFQRLDEQGVGALMEIAIAKGRKVRPDMSIGLCGEHGGQADSVKLCHRLGLDYVSASPYRVPVARLAAAQAALEQQAARAM